MGTEVTVIADDADAAVFPGAVSRVIAIFEREEQRFSRFRPDSELSVINRSAGDRVEMSEAFAEVVHLALAGAASTEGLFDPTVIDALERAGYDRDFPEIARRDHGTPITSAPCGGWRAIEVHDRHLFLPAGLRLDLGGIAKGWTVDVAAQAALAVGLRWVVVNAGGDLRVAGVTSGISVGIEDPDDHRATLLDVEIDGGALATTSVTRRSWGPDLHHVIDPRVGRPSRTPVVQATVWEPTCAAAEIAAKRVVLAGVPSLDDTTGVIVLSTGEIVMNIGAAA
jgi:thiamine biosynthesis lipoprotein